MALHIYIRAARTHLNMRTKQGNKEIGQRTSYGCNVSNSINGSPVRVAEGTIRPIPIGNGPSVEPSAAAQ